MTVEKRAAFMMNEWDWEKSTEMFRKWLDSSVAVNAFTKKSTHSHTEIAKHFKWHIRILENKFQTISLKQ